MRSHADKSGQLTPHALKNIESVVKIKRKPLSSFVSVFDCDGLRSVLMVSLGVGRTLF